MYIFKASVGHKRLVVVQRGGPKKLHHLRSSTSLAPKKQASYYREKTTFFSGTPYRLALVLFIFWGLIPISNRARNNASKLFVLFLYGFVGNFIVFILFLVFFVFFYLNQHRTASHPTGEIVEKNPTLKIYNRHNTRIKNTPKVKTQF